MSYQLDHTWPAQGTKILDTVIGSCSVCGVLRAKNADGRTIYIRPTQIDGGRVVEESPPCVAEPRRRSSP